MADTAENARQHVSVLNRIRACATAPFLPPNHVHLSRIMQVLPLTEPEPPTRHPGNHQPAAVLSARAGPLSAELSRLVRRCMDCIAGSFVVVGTRRHTSDRYERHRGMGQARE